MRADEVAGSGSEACHASPDTAGRCRRRLLPPVGPGVGIPTQGWCPCDTIARVGPVCGRVAEEPLHDGWARGHAEAAVTHTPALPGHGAEHERQQARERRGDGPVHGTA